MGGSQLAVVYPPKIFYKGCHDTSTKIIGSIMTRIGQGKFD